MISQRKEMPRNSTKGCWRHVGKEKSNEDTGGEEMKTISAISLMAILVTAAVMPGLQDAFAIKADTSDRLAPKSYGEKTLAKLAASGIKQVKTFDVKPVAYSENEKKIRLLKVPIPSDTGDKLGPKSYGSKMLAKMPSADTMTHTEGFVGIKSEQVKNFKKQIATMVAQETLKQLYRTR